MWPVSTTREKKHPFPAAGGAAASGAGLLLVLLLLALLSGCVPPPPDPQGAEVHRSRAEELIIKRDLPAAAAELELALGLNPEDADLRFRLGEILEAAGRPREALAVYEKTGRILNEKDPRHQELTYRSALLEAAKLERSERAQQRLAELPAGSIPYLDLQGVITLQQGDARQALQLYNQALQQGPGKDMAARILYHASLAYHRLDDMKNTYGMLYRAVNLADDQGLLADIERFFSQLNAGSADR